jgi:hypothetical protein
MTSKKGLKSLNERLSTIENNMQQTPYNSGGEEDHYLNKHASNSLATMMNDMKKREQKQKDDALNSILVHFQNDLVNSNIKINNDNLLEILIFCMKYVEENSLKLGSYLNAKHNSVLKKNLAISFYKHVCDEYSDSLLEATIDTIHPYIFPKANTNDVDILEKDNKKKKKSFFSKN